MKKNAPLIILDRDGVINIDSPAYVKSAEEWHPIPGSIETRWIPDCHSYQPIRDWSWLF
jgi:hypothetical protein